MRPEGEGTSVLLNQSCFVKLLEAPAQARDVDAGRSVPTNSDENGATRRAERNERCVVCPRERSDLLEARTCGLRANAPTQGTSGKV